MENMTFERFEIICKDLAAKLQTICEVTKYPEYGWNAIAFMTDHFGGVYVNLHYDLQTNVITNWYGNKDATEVKSISFLSSLVEKEMNKTLESRDLYAISEMINDEY